MRFTKMHGLGNDYIYLNCMEGMPEDPAALARRLSDRHFGVGGDGLICICPSGKADFRMRMFNADGSEGAMCGNGIRCLGKFVYDKGLTDKTALTIETLSGERSLWLTLEGGQVAGATVDMGLPAIGAPLEVEAGGRRYRAIPVSMGNPHAVVEAGEPDALPLAELGPAFQRCPAFSDGVNVEFIRLEGPDRLRLRVWERGSGETLACGTGACAAAAAMMTAGRLAPVATVRLPGGELQVRWQEGGAMYMTGPAVTVYEGELAPGW